MRKISVWRSLPPIYDSKFSGVTMLAKQNPYIIGVHEVFADQPSALHWHDSFEIGYILEGTGISVLEGQEFRFEPGQVHVVNDRYRHMDYAQDYARVFNVHFHPDLLRDTGFRELESIANSPFVAGTQRFTPLLPANDPHTEQIVALLKVIADEHANRSLGWPLMVKGVILQIIGLLIRHFVIPAPVEAAHRQELLERLAPALRLLDANLTDPPSLAELAEEAALSPSHFGVMFREALGSSPVAYRNAQRVANAQRMLAETNETIATISDRCGFATIQQFNRIFRRLTGCTPSDYRTQSRTIHMIGS